MERVYIVRNLYHESTSDPADLYNAEIIEKVFKDEDDAIKYIYDRIRKSHKDADECWPADEHIIKYEPDVSGIRDGWKIDAWERNSDELYVVVSFMYDSYVVE